MIREAQDVLGGAAARLREYGIADDAALEVGLACGGAVAILIAPLDLSFVPALEEAVASDRAVALTLVAAATDSAPSSCTSSRWEQWHGCSTPVSALADVDGEAVFVHALTPRPALYVFGAIDHAAALARVGLLGYRVTVCDAGRRS